MNRKLTTIIFLMVIISLAFATELPFNDDYFHPKSIVVGFTAEAVGDRYGRIDFTLNEEGIIVTQLDTINRLAEEFRIVDLVQMHEFVKHLDWNENGIYLQNIYRIVLESNDNIEKAQAAIVKDKNILFAEYETINSTRMIPNDPDYQLQWHHPVIKMPETWDYVQGSSEVIVAITDSGVKWNHPDLADNIWINEAELPGITINWANGQILGGDGIDNDGNGKIDDIIGWDFYHNNNNPYQYHPGSSHGTHVAGISGAVGNNSIGVAGVAMNVSIMSCKGSPTGVNSSGISHGYNQIQYAADSGADIINCSWGGPGSGTYPNSVINYATSLGSLVVAAAGNENVQHIPGVYEDYPADATNAFCVASTGPNDTKSSFSDYGTPIDISAPGSNIRSTWGDNAYYTTSGTSMASPVVAGVAALVKTLHPEMTPSELKSRIMMTSYYIDDLNPDHAGLLGAGRVDAFSATMSDKIPYITVYNHNVHEHSGDGDGVPNPGEEVNLIFSLYNEIFWMTAENVVATISTDEPGLELLIDTVEFPNINGGSIVFNNNNPFRISTSPTLSNLTIPITLTITANPGNPFPYEVSYEHELVLSLQQAGWPLTLSGTSTSPAIIHDVNADGTSNIIFGDAQGNLRVVNPNKTAIDGFPVNLGGNISSAVAAADITGNSQLEIVANTQNGFIHCVDNAGNVLFQYNAGGQLRSNPMLVDVNNDGSLEIVAVTFSSPKLIILYPDGTDYPGFPVDLPAAVMSSPASADLNGDGHKEIIIASTSGNIHAVSTSTGQDIAGWPQTIGSASWNGPVVGDVTGNGQPDVAVATVLHNVFAFDSQGNQIFNRNVGSAIRTSVLVHDLNNDGSSEIIFGDMTGRLFVVDSNGDDVGVFPVNIGNPIESTPILADMTNSGTYEMIFGAGSYVHSINLAGENTPNFPVYIGPGITVSPTIGSVNQNGNPDILIPNNSGYNFIDFKRPIGSIGWSEFKGNMRRTGNSFDMVNIEEGGVVEENHLRTQLNRNYPNPFNPVTRISFSIGNESDVRIRIYNIKGQQIKALINERMVPGDYDVVWNGQDEQGKDVSSGMYFYTLETDEHRQSRKMLLLK